MVKRRYLPVIIVCLTIIIACSQKKKGTKETYISVVSIIKGQLNHIDTSLYSIIKLTNRDTLPADTEYIRRETVRGFAKDFLELPELTKDRFKEENIPGPGDYLSTMIYTPLDPDKDDIARIELIMDPRLAEIGKNVIKSIFVDRSTVSRDSSIQKKLLWQMDQSFQITTLLQKPGRPETTSTMKVVWDSEENDE